MQKVVTAITVELNKDQIASIFEYEFDGWCPVCKRVEINVGETVCCDCFQKALGYHINTCGCKNVL